MAIPQNTGHSTWFVAQHVYHAEECQEGLKGVAFYNTHFWESAGQSRRGITPHTQQNKAPRCQVHKRTLSALSQPEGGFVAVHLLAPMHTTWHHGSAASASHRELPPPDLKAYSQIANSPLQLQQDFLLSAPLRMQNVFGHHQKKAAPPARLRTLARSCPNVLHDGTLRPPQHVLLFDLSSAQRHLRQRALANPLPFTHTIGAKAVANLIQITFLELLSFRSKGLDESLISVRATAHIMSPVSVMTHEKFLRSPQASGFLMTRFGSQESRFASMRTVACLIWWSLREYWGSQQKQQYTSRPQFC